MRFDSVILTQIKLSVFMLMLCLAKGFQERNFKSTAAPSSTPDYDNFKERSNSNTLLKNDKAPTPVQSGETENDNGLVEVKEDEIPEGSMVYVLDEPIDAPVDGEILKTANNIVFRPLFRYRGKQEALRRNYNTRIRRRYFVPKRSYRQTYYPYYYPYRYY